MSEMIATANAKSIEEIKSFLSKQKETLRDPSCRPSAPVRLCWHDQSAGFFAP